MEQCILTLKEMNHAGGQLQDGLKQIGVVGRFNFPNYH